MDSVFFYASKVFWTLLNPGNMLLLLCLLGVFLLYRKCIRAAKYCLTVSIVSLLLIAILPCKDWLLRPLETRYAIPQIMPEQIAGIIVLGGAEKLLGSADWQQVQLNRHAERVTMGVQLAYQYADVPLVYASGSGAALAQEFSGAVLVKPLLIGLGLPESRLILETQSRNTYENVRNLQQLLQPDTEGAPWVVVTSAAHMPRSIAIFERFGWDVLPYPVDFVSQPAGETRFEFSLSHNLRDVEYALHEWMGLLAYRITGKIKHL